MFGVFYKSNQSHWIYVWSWEHQIHFIQTFCSFIYWKVFVDEGLKNNIAHIYVYIYMVINHTIGQNYLVKGYLKAQL
jgi:hypothetical protein